MIHKETYASKTMKRLNSTNNYLTSVELSIRTSRVISIDVRWLSHENLLSSHVGSGCSRGGCSFGQTSTKRIQWISKPRNRLDDESGFLPLPLTLMILSAKTGSSIITLSSNLLMNNKFDHWLFEFIILFKFKNHYAILSYYWHQIPPVIRIVFK